MPACSLTLKCMPAAKPGNNHTPPLPTYPPPPTRSTLPCTRGVFRTSAIMGLGPPVGDGVFGFQARQLSKPLVLEQDTPATGFGRHEGQLCGAVELCLALKPAHQPLDCCTAHSAGAVAHPAPLPGR